MDYLKMSKDPLCDADEYVYGYRVKDLILFAKFCNKAGVDPEGLERFSRNISQIWGMMAAFMKKSVDDTKFDPESLLWLGPS